MPRWDVNFNTRVNTSNPGLLCLVAEAHAYSSVILSIPVPPAVQQRLNALNIMRAVRGTTGIEGADLSEDEVEKIISSPRKKKVLPESRSRDEQEARNADILMRYIAQTLSRQPNLELSEDLIRRMHEIITRDIDYQDNIPGRYRTHSVHAGSYVPPRTEEEIQRLIKEFIEWYHNGPPKEWDPTIRAVVAHFYIVSIHPFGDGNGRLSRGVESFILYKAGINARGFYSLANYYYRNRNEYVRMLDFVRFNTQGDLTPFVLFALRGLVQELKEVNSEVLGQVLIIAYRDYVREILEKNNKLGTEPGERMFHFLLELSAPVSLRELRSRKHRLSRYYLGLSNKTLSRDIEFFRRNRLIVIDGDNILPNVSVMTRFMPSVVAESISGSYE